MIFNIDENNNINIIDYSVMVAPTAGGDEFHLEVWQSISDFIKDFPLFPLSELNLFKGVAYEPTINHYCDTNAHGVVECFESSDATERLKWIKENINNLKNYGIALRRAELDNTRGDS